MKRYIYILLFFTFCSQVNAQPDYYNFKFTIDSKSQLDTITNYISIDNVEDLTVFAWANHKQWQTFLSWQLPYTLIQNNKSKVINMATTTAEMNHWDRYPTYDVYVQLMQNFATNFPEICQLQEIGTLSSGRKLLAIKLSDNVDQNNEPEPELLYTSSMHGDELTGFVLMLRFIDYLLNNYNNTNLPYIKNLIDNAEIWINPLANPDGAYFSGNSTVANAIRSNSNGVDLNRNFPDPVAGDHPDGNQWQEETVLMMNFASSHHFALSGNFHGGAEVVNYPWDTWSKLAADDNWWQMVSREFADSLQTNSPAGYFTDLNNGITNGYAWYHVNGSRQDYMNYFHNCREATFEISATKLISSDLLTDYWNYNKGGLLAYLIQGLHGIHGKVTDSLGQPLEARISIDGHDIDNSWIETDIRAGDYSRYLKAGIYNLTYSVEGFNDTTIENVSVSDNQKTQLNVIFGKTQPFLELDCNGIDTTLQWGTTFKDTLTIKNSGLANLNYNINIENSSANTWIKLDNNEGIIEPNQSHNIIVEIYTHELFAGNYNCKIQISGDTSLTIPVLLTVSANPGLNTSFNEIDQTLLMTETWTDTLILWNNGHADLSYTIEVKDSAIKPSFTIVPELGTISPTVKDSITISFNGAKSGAGYFQTTILIEGDLQHSIPTALTVDTLPHFVLSETEITLHSTIGHIDTTNIIIANAGGDSLAYTSLISFNDKTEWLSLSTTDTILERHSSFELDIIANCKNLSRGNHTALVWLYSIYDTTMLRINLMVDTLPKLKILSDTKNLTVFKEQLAYDTVLLTNIGDGEVLIDPQIHFQNSTFINWIVPFTENTTVRGNDTLEWIYMYDTRSITTGTFNARISFTANLKDTVHISLNVLKKSELVPNKQFINIELSPNQKTVETIILQNTGDENLPISNSINESSWLGINPQKDTIWANQNDTLLLHFDTHNMVPGEYTNNLLISSVTTQHIPILLSIIGSPILSIDTNLLSFAIPPFSSETKAFYISNIGYNQLIYEIIINNEDSWLSLNSENLGSLYRNEQIEISFTAQSNTSTPNQQKTEILIQTNDTDTTITAQLNVLTGNSLQHSAGSLKIYPNPFKSEVNITNNSISSDEVIITIHNILGQRIKLLKKQGVNNHVYLWNGTNEANQAVPPGTYIVLIRDNTTIKKAIIQKQ